MSKVKLFDLNRLARFNDDIHETVLFVPGDIVGIIVTNDYKTGSPNGNILLHLAEGVSYTIKATLEEFEAEINRALAATSSAAHEYADESAKEIADKLIQLKATIKDADMLANNDFCPDLNKDKKGYN